MIGQGIAALVTGLIGNQLAENTTVIDSQRLREQILILSEILASIQFPERPAFLPYQVDHYSFNIATNERELLETFKLRFIAYSPPEVAYINPANFPLGLEFDIYDKVSIHFYARDIITGLLCGTSRMVEDSPLGLQVEKGLNILDYRQHYKVCEMSRMISYPRRQPVVNRNLIAIVKRIARERGIEKIVGESRLAQKNYFDRIGFVPMVPFRSWNLRDKKVWGSEREEIVYGNILHLDQEGLK